MAKISETHTHLANVTMVMVNVDAETNILRCMDVEKRSYFSINGTQVKDYYRVKGELSHTANGNNAHVTQECSCIGHF